MPRIETRPTVATYVSGNLAAKTMVLVLTYLRQHYDYDLQVFTDGYLPTVNATIPAQHLPPDRARELIASSALLISSIRSPGTAERSLIRTARRLRVPSLVILADIGSGAQKFRDDEGFAWPDYVAVSDPLTHELLLRDGAPAATLLEVGSPYLDHIGSRAGCLERAAGTPRCGQTACFYGVPNTVDFNTWNTSVHYSELDVMNGLKSVLSLVEGLIFSVRLHPKELEGHPYGAYAGPRIRIQDRDARPSVVDCVLSHAIGISTYSTALLVTRLVGRPAISFQPYPGPIVRQELYQRLGIPITHSAHDLACSLTAALSEADTEALPCFRYNEGSSIERIAAVVASILDGVRPPVCNSLHPT